MKKYYQINVSLRNGENYKRVLKTNTEVSLDNIRGGVLKDVFFKIEHGDLGSVEDIDFKEIGKEVYEGLKNINNIIILVLDDDGYVKRPLTGIN